MTTHGKVVPPAPRAGPAGSREDLTLVLRRRRSPGYGSSKVLLAKARFDGTLQLLTSGWERLLGYEPGALEGKTLSQLMWGNGHSAAAAVMAILGTDAIKAVEVRLRRCDGRAVAIRMHRHYDGNERVMYIAAEESAAAPSGSGARSSERRAAGRRA